MEQSRSSSISSVLPRDVVGPAVARRRRRRDRVALPGRQAGDLLGRSGDAAQRAAKSGRSISASSRPATQKMCMCVNRASSPSTATISNCSFWPCAPCAPAACAAGRTGRQQHRRDDHDDGGDDVETVGCPGRRHEPWKVVRSERVDGCGHEWRPLSPGIAHRSGGDLAMRISIW